MKKIVLVIGLFFLLISCQSISVTEVVATPVPTKVPTNTIIPSTATSTVEPTSTPVPPTLTSIPSLTTLPVPVSEILYDNFNELYFMDCQGGKTDLNPTFRVGDEAIITNSCNGIPIMIGAVNEQNKSIRILCGIGSVSGFQETLLSALASRVHYQFYLLYFGQDSNPTRPDQNIDRVFGIAFGNPANRRVQDWGCYRSFEDVFKTQITDEYMSAVQEFVNTGVWNYHRPLFPISIWRK